VRIVDCFTDVFLYARKLSRGDIHVESAEEARNTLKTLFEKSQDISNERDFSTLIYADAIFPVVAFVDELFLTSSWDHKNEWKLNPLQREYFNTTNAGAEFYDRLSVLNKFGPDRDVREVYALCMGLGFRGKYFRGEDRQRYEEIKSFNLSFLLPDEAQQNIDSATLFPFAYRGHSDDDGSSYIPRLNIYPILIGVPIAIIVVLSLYFHFDIASTLNHLQQLIKY
jgi:type VI secretion system protein ImpK